MDLQTLLTIFTPFILIASIVIIIFGFYTQYLNLKMMSLLRKKYSKIYSGLKFDKMNAFRPIETVKFSWKKDFPKDKNIEEYKRKIRRSIKYILASLLVIVISVVMIFGSIFAFGIYA